MIYQRVLDFLHNFQTQVGAMKRFSSWDFDDQEKRNIAQAIEKDICFQFYPISKQTIEEIIEKAI